MSLPALRLLGAPAVLVDGRERHLDRKPLALLAFLAVTGEPVRRERLAALLWPEADRGRAATNLRKAIWALRRTLGSEVLSSDSTASSLALGPGASVDVLRFEDLLAACDRHGDEPQSTGAASARELARALELYSGGFLSGFSLPDCPDFDRWQSFHEERLRQRLAIALDRLVDHHLQRRNLGEALRLAIRRLELDPLNESAHRQLMRLHAWSGSRAEALRRYEACAALLSDELGAEPEAATAALARQIRDDRLPPPASSRPLPAGAVLDLAERIVVGERPRGPGSPLGLEGSVDAARQALLAAVLDPRRRAKVDDADLRALAAAPPTDLAAYRLARLARWSLPRHRLDRRFVELGLLVDQGEESAGGRWQARETRYSDLAAALDALEAPILALLGPPGSGKSTLLRRLELDLAAAGLRDRSAALAILAELGSHRPEGIEAEPPEPAAWLARRWRRRYPGLPELETLLREREIVLLLDGLNELPHDSALDYSRAVERWKAFALELVRSRPGTRVVFSCRSLDYSTPLSTPDLRVPQLRVEPLDEEGLQRFLEQRCPRRSTRLWSAIQGSGHAELFRRPFFLVLLIAQEDVAAELPLAPAALISTCLRKAMRREVERDNPRFEPGRLLDTRDRLRLVNAQAWGSAHALPCSGPLVAALEDLAWGMQAQLRGRQLTRLRLSFDEACRLAGEPGAEALRGGVDLGVLEEDLGTDGLMFTHQLFQEYFAARRLAVKPDPERARSPWRLAEQAPSLEVLIETLGAGEPLPALPGSAWAETWRLAAEMLVEPEPPLDALAEIDPCLAASCAELANVRARLSDGFLMRLRERLRSRSRDAEADLRARVAAGLALGRLGDPRFLPAGDDAHAALLPPLVEIDAAGGADGTERPDGKPGRDGLAIGRFPVTNAEWSRFMDDGGYDEPRWWPGAEAEAWCSGAATARGVHDTVRHWLAKFRSQPELMEAELAAGRWSEEVYERWQRRIAMSEPDLTAHLQALYPGGRLVEPAFWREASLSNPAQPVVGVCWYEAVAYCLWLTEQAGRRFRLPTAAEWQLAAGGRAGRAHAYGDRFDPLKANCLETHLRQTSPVGVFPEGNSLCGASDMSGNVQEWLALDGPLDGIASEPLRHAAGGGWNLAGRHSRCASSEQHWADLRAYDIGFRVLSSEPASPGAALRSEDDLRWILHAD